ncbi:MAG TPA: hypothetical protein VHV82_15835, partial [Sporichthyaceae bacterium]|nr:hypothetical protein [Sporichthyaceae bacterium]
MTSGLPRRAVLGGLALGLVSASVGCGTRSGGPPPTPAGAGSPTPTPSATPTAQLPQLTAWAARPGEVNPAVKARATGLLQAVGSWTSGGAAAAR